MWNLACRTPFSDGLSLVILHLVSYASLLDPAVSTRNKVSLRLQEVMASIRSPWWWYGIVRVNTKCSSVCVACEKRFSSDPNRWLLSMCRLRLCLRRLHQQ